MPNDGIERAALLLIGLGEDHAGEVMRHLEPRQIQKVGEKISTMSEINPQKLDNVVDEFLSEVKNQMGMAIDSEEYVKNMLIKGLGEERARPIIDRIIVAEQKGGLNLLKWLEGQTIAEVIRNEHPQIIATILTYLDSEQAADVVKCFPEEKRINLLVRMCNIDTIKPEALHVLGGIIEEQVSGLKQGKAASVGGIKSVADLVNYLDGQTETQVLEGIADVDEELSEKIQEKMFVFENLNEMDGRSIQSLLREVSTEVLMLALKGGTERVKEKIFSNMSKRAGDLLKDDLEAQGPVKVTEVEMAQREILDIARKLADAGEISLGGKGGEEMI